MNKYFQISSAFLHRNWKIIVLAISIFFILLLTLHIVGQSRKYYQDQAPIKGRICLIIDDFGYSINETVAGFLNLDTDLTFAVIPGHTHSRKIGEMANSLNFEVIVHMPMEPHEFLGYNPEKYLLTETMNYNAVKELVNRVFSELPMAVGMNNHQGSKATENFQLMKNLGRTLRPMNKYYIDSFTTPESKAFVIMRRLGVKTDVRQLFLDNIAEFDHIEAQLDSLVTLSGDMGLAIGIGHVKPITLEVLKAKIPELETAGYRFIKASAIVR